MTLLPDPLKRRYLAEFEVARIPHRFTDVLVIGSGVAGLSAALAASEDPEVMVLLASKLELEESATRWAQGGVAAVLHPERTGDSEEKHLSDSLEAGAGLGDAEAVRVTVTEGVERVRELLDLGATFDRDQDGQLQLTREGAHSYPRILHRGDTTGQENERALLAAVAGRENIVTLAHTFAVDLLTRELGGSGGPGRITCHGALACRPGGGLEAVWARQTVLATGGAGRLFRETTNPSVCTGDGLAMAFRAGAILQDLEFVQFHPTTLYMAGAERFLITEAVRGEGGVLRDGDGNRFMERFHRLKDLAPRDVVSRAILQVMHERHENKVWLDLSGIAPDRIRARFPRILEICRGFGIDILRQPIPVRPSAHYSIGGVQTTTHGTTSVEGLLAAGEVACTGLHGANRLGSNSLLEGLVFGHRCGELARRCRDLPLPTPFSPTSFSARAAAETTVAAGSPGELNLDDLRTSLKSLLWHKVGVERSGAQLTAALTQIRAWIRYGLSARFTDPESWSLQNMLQTAYLITLCALRREESRGVHYREDFPERDDEEWRRHQTISRFEL